MGDDEFKHNLEAMKNVKLPKALFTHIDLNFGLDKNNYIHNVWDELSVCSQSTVCSLHRALAHILSQWHMWTCKYKYRLLHMN